jgi:hypothetical protein
MGCQNNFFGVVGLLVMAFALLLFSAYVEIVVGLCLFYVFL